MSNEPFQSSFECPHCGQMVGDESAETAVAALKAEVERLRGALEKALTLMESTWTSEGKGGPIFWEGDLAELRAALAPSDPKPAPKFIAWTPRGVLLTGDSINHLYELWGDRTWPDDVEFRSADGTDPQSAKEME